VSDERESPPARRPTPANPTQSAGRQDQPPVQKKLSNAVEFDPPQVPVKSEGRTDQPRRQTESQTAQGPKADQSIGLSRQDLAGSRDPRAGTNGSNSHSTPEQMSGQGRQQPDTRSVQASAELKFASAGSLQGDSPAASIAKFLLADISGSPSPDSVARGAADRPTGFTHLAADPTSPPPALARTPGTFGGQVLASGVEGPDQIAAAARVLRASSGSGRFQVKMQLHPPELGQLKLHIQMQQQTLTLSVEVQTQAVAKLIESRLSELHEALATHGIRVDRTDVVTRSSAPADPQTQRQDSDHAAGDQADHPADQPPDTWTSDQGWPDAPPDHDSSSSDSPGGLGDQTSADLAAGRAEHPEPIDAAQTTIRSLDLVA
jgi:flagellar hook-length control protein FliK